jgi:transposase
MAGRKNETLSKKVPSGEAFAYVLNQWDALCYYCEDGLAEPDNNAAEQPFVPSVLGKRILSSSAATTVVSAEPCCTD